MSRWVYRFEDADPEDVALLGGKGAGLARMSRAGLPVPPGFIITTHACAEYVVTGKLPAGVTEAVRAQVAALERETKRSFGGGPVPLLVSVRSGAPVSMPGMMETILNLGIGRDAAVALAEATGEPEFVLDVTRRLQKGFSEVVLGADPDVVDVAVANFALRADGTPFGETFDRYWALLPAGRGGRRRRGGTGGPMGPAAGGGHGGSALLEQPARDHLPRASQHLP